MTWACRHCPSWATKASYSWVNGSTCTPTGYLTSWVAHTKTITNETKPVIARKLRSCVVYRDYCREAADSAPLLRWMLYCRSILKYTVERSLWVEMIHPLLILVSTKRLSHSIRQWPLITANVAQSILVCGKWLHFAKWSYTCVQSWKSVDTVNRLIACWVKIE